ncbi:MAG: hypothetical protein JXB48_00835 [Candidatus Latescibacteria bacterium]|nr:hypothetical protein [Candidatus Latescibacterota bacterium]
MHDKKCMSLDIRFVTNKLPLRLLMFLLVITLFISPVVAGVENTKPDMLYFYSEGCDECQNVKREFLPGFLEKYSHYINFIELDVEELANIDSLFALESRVNIIEADKGYPAIYFMGTMVEGEIPVVLQLESLVKAYLANPDSMWANDREVKARMPEEFEPVQMQSDNKVHLAYFFEQGCKKCGRALEIISWLEQTYTNVSVHKFDIEIKKNKLIAAALGLKTGVPEKELMSTPVFFTGNSFILAKDISREKLSGLVVMYSVNGAEPSWEYFSDTELKQAENMIHAKFQSFGLIVVALAGLGDGVNPCAFATLLFFVSYLGMVGRKGREILVVGFAFSFSVFLTYFLVGLGFFNIIKSMANIDVLAKFIFGGTAILCIIFGFLSIADYFKARAGNTSEMALQLPTFLKKRIHTTIRENVRMQGIVAGAIVAGFMVSILELACTGQVYLPTIIFMLGNAGSRVTAGFYLLLYNLFFIIPLLVVFGIVYTGVSSNSVAKIMETKVGMVKLGLAGIFFTVAGLLIWSIY